MVARPDSVGFPRRFFRLAIWLLWFSRRRAAFVSGVALLMIAVPFRLVVGSAAVLVPRGRVCEEGVDFVLLQDGLEV